MHWRALKNGDLLSKAEQEFDVFLTVDRRMRYQQNFSNRSISVIVLKAPRIDLPTLRPLIPKVLAVLEESQPGTFVEIGD